MLLIGCEMLLLRREPYFLATCSSVQLDDEEADEEAGLFLLEVGLPQLFFFTYFLFLIDVFIERTVKPAHPRSHPYQQVNLQFCFLMLAEVGQTCIYYFMQPLNSPQVPIRSILLNYSFVFKVLYILCLWATLFQFSIQS